VTDTTAVFSSDKQVKLNTPDGMVAESPLTIVLVASLRCDMKGEKAGVTHSRCEALPQLPKQLHSSTSNTYNCPALRYPAGTAVAASRSYVVAKNSFITTSSVAFSCTGVKPDSDTIALLTEIDTFCQALPTNPVEDVMSRANGAHAACSEGASMVMSGTTSSPSVTCTTTGAIIDIEVVILLALAPITPGITVMLSPGSKVELLSMEMIKWDESRQKHRLDVEEGNDSSVSQEKCPLTNPPAKSVLESKVITTSFALPINMALTTCGTMKDASEAKK
jgi:hypothetical protein